MENPLPTPVAAAPPPATPLATTWPRSAQLATAFLLGVAATLLLIHGAGALRFGSRPSELDRAPLPGYRIDVNRATRAELLQVPGLGPALADRIADHQRRHGAFRTVDELRQVQGIGPGTLERLRPWLCVGEMTEVAELPQQPVERRSLYPPPASSMEPEARPVAGKKGSLTGPVDLNTATSAQLQMLSGVGPVLSQRILDERSRRPFKSVDDLRRVAGIGPKTLERLRPHVTVSAAAAPLVTADPPETATERP